MKENELVAADDSRMIILIIYDIVNNKKRLAMVKCLSRYAVRVQKSCFEGFLTPRQCEQMELEASRIIDFHEDSLRVYKLQDHTKVKSWGKGEIKTEDVIIY